jgi:hypothetical protein
MGAHLQQNVRSDERKLFAQQVTAGFSRFVFIRIRHPTARRTASGLMH